MIKKLLLIMTLCWSVFPLSAQYCGNSGSVQCTPGGSYSTPGLYPSSVNLLPFNNNVYVDTILQFKAYSNVSGIGITSMRLDSLTNLPPGLCWSSNIANNTFTAGSVACIHIKGIACGATGQYKLNFYFYINALVNFAQTGDQLGMKYFMRLKNSNEAATPVDSTQLTSHPINFYGTQCGSVAPLIVSLGSDQNMSCAGSVSLSPAVSGGVPPYTYAWHFAGDSLSCTSCAGPSAIINRNSTFIVTVTDYAGSHINDTVNYNFVSDGNFRLNSASGSCLGDTFTVVSSTIPNALIWTLNGTAIDTVRPAYILNNTVGRVTGTNFATSAVAIDKNGYTYVSDAHFSRVTKFSPGNRIQTAGITAAGSATAGSGLNQLNQPQDIFVDTIVRLNF